MVLDVTDLKKTQEDLMIRTEQLNESNLALKVLIDQRDKDRQDMDRIFPPREKILHLSMEQLADAQGDCVQVDPFNRKAIKPCLVRTYDPGTARCGESYKT
jgi:hypothetical protein